MKIKGDEYIDYAAAAELAGLGRSVLQRLVTQGLVASARPGRKRLINKISLEHWLSAQVSPARRPVGRPRAGTARR